MDHKKVAERVIKDVGRDNIIAGAHCATRLRLVLKDTSIVNEAALKQTGSMGIVRINENNIQIVYGPKVEEAAHALKKAVGTY